jgi:sirohydrochlorin cobaltochelatase
MTSGAPSPLSPSSTFLRNAEGLEIDNVTEALDRLVSDGVKTLIVQPTHLMNGYEYDDIVDSLEGYADKVDSIAVGAPLLSTAEDRAAVIDVITSETASYSNDDTAVIFMGHGTEHEANAVYATMQKEITAAGFSNYFFGTVEATPSLDDMIAAATAGGYKKVVLEPLMVVAGDHANNDMAGDEADSWKSKFERQVLKLNALSGAGQFEGIQQIYVQHVQNALTAKAS